MLNLLSLAVIEAAAFAQAALTTFKRATDSTRVRDAGAKFAARRVSLPQRSTACNGFRGPGLLCFPYANPAYWIEKVERKLHYTPPLIIKVPVDFHTFQYVPHRVPTGCMCVCVCVCVPVCLGRRNVSFPGHLISPRRRPLVYPFVLNMGEGLGETPRRCIQNLFQVVYDFFELERESYSLDLPAGKIRDLCLHYKPPPPQPPAHPPKPPKPPKPPRPPYPPRAPAHPAGHQHHHRERTPSPGGAPTTSGRRLLSDDRERAIANE